MPDCKDPAGHPHASDPGQRTCALSWLAALHLGSNRQSHKQQPTDPAAFFAFPLDSQDFMHATADAAVARNSNEPAAWV